MVPQLPMMSFLEEIMPIVEMTTRTVHGKALKYLKLNQKTKRWANLA